MIELRNSGFIILIILLMAIIAINYAFGTYLFSAQQNYIVEYFDLTYDFIGLTMFLNQVGFLLGSLLVFFFSQKIKNVYFFVISLSLTLLATIFLSYTEKSQFMVFAPFVLLMTGLSASISWSPMVDVIAKFCPDKYRALIVSFISSGTAYGIFVNGWLVSHSSSENWQQKYEIISLTILCFLLIFLIYIFFINKKMLSVQSNNHVLNEVKKTKPDKKIIYYIYVSMFFLGFCYIPFNSYLSTYLSGEVDVSSEILGNIWTINGLIGMFSGFLLGCIADKKGYKLGIILSYVFLFLSIFILLLNFNRELFIYISIIFFALSFYPIFGLFPSHISTVSPNSTTKICAMGNFLLGIGVNGFTIALLLLQTGLKATIVSKVFSPKTTSNIAGALWEFLTSIIKENINIENLSKERKWSLFAF